MNYHIETLNMIMYAIDFASNNGCPENYTERQFSFIQKRLDKESNKIRKRIYKIQNAKNHKTNRRAKHNLK